MIPSGANLLLPLRFPLKTSFGIEVRYHTGSLPEQHLCPGSLACSEELPQRSTKGTRISGTRLCFWCPFVAWYIMLRSISRPLNEYHINESNPVSRCATLGKSAHHTFRRRDDVSRERPRVRRGRAAFPRRAHG